MNQIKNNKLLELGFLYLLFLAFGIFFISSFGFTMPDDGWRHLAMASYPEQVQSWGRIYPHTLYEDFDPWFMWHNLLRFVNNFVAIEKVPIVVNSIVYSFLSLWYFLALKKFTKIDKLFIIILAIGLPLLNYRYFFLRADILSGLFVLYFLISKNKILITALAFIYAPFYYVFWFYFAYLGYLNLLLKEYSKFIILSLAMVFGFIFYLSYDFHGFLQMTQNVLNNDILLQGHSVGESKPFIISLDIKNYLGSSLTLIFLMLFSLLLYFVFKPTTLLTKYVYLLVPLFLIQFRFLYTLQPLLYIFFLHITYNSYTIIKKNNLTYFINLIKTFLKERTYFPNLATRGKKIVVLILLVLFFFYQYTDNLKGYSKIQENLTQLNFLKENEFKNKKILFSSMSTSVYMATFLNPSASYVPGCSLGWVTYKNKKTYFNLLFNNKLNMNDFYIFLNENKPDYLIIDTLANSNFNFSHEEIKNNGFIFYKIINSKLIFRKIK
ncbi:MAG: hypothetical protein WBF48_02550 [Halarcobacter sp.]